MRCLYTTVYNLSVADRPVAWLGSSLADLCDFPEEARRSAGYQLRRVQQGLMPTDWKPVAAVGPGVVEIRIQTGLQHRVLYVARFREAVYVLHSSQKKSRKIREADLDVARSRLKELEADRRARRES
jgi:phage-related protein